MVMCDLCYKFLYEVSTNLITANVKMLSVDFMYLDLIFVMICSMGKFSVIGCIW